MDAPWNASSHLLLLGGLAAGDSLGRGIFESFDGGLNYERPFCTPPDPAPPPNRGGCNFGSNSYQLPQTPAFPGSVVAHPSGGLYFWHALKSEADGGSDLYVLNETNAANGFYYLSDGDTANALGRRVWVSGAASGGCLFSTDFLDMDLFTDWNMTAPSSSAFFSVAASPMGPWSLPAPAPWPPRVAPAVLPFAKGGTSILVGGGLCMVDRVAVKCTDPSAGEDGTWGDVWVVDAGVCLLDAGSGAVCNGKAQPDLDTVTCPCPLAWSGSPTCGACGKGFVGAACDACEPGLWGPTCAACAAPCVHGTCSGTGTTGGTGACMCDAGWMGSSCSVATSSTATPMPTSGPSGKTDGGGGKGLAPGAAAGVAVAVVLAALGGGGGPLCSLWGRGAGAVRGLAEERSGGEARGCGSGAGRGGGGERAGLLRAPPVAAVQQRLRVAPQPRQAAAAATGTARLEEASPFLSSHGVL